MTLNREDFPEMSDEQWKAIEAEADRRATEASKSAKRGLVKESDVQARIEEALSEAKARAEMDAKELLEADRKAFEQEQAKFASERRTFTAKQKLVEGGIPADKIESLLPLFAGVDDKVLEATVDTFVTTYNDGVKAKADETKQSLLHGATPPSSPTTGPVDTATAVQKLIDDGDAESAVATLLNDAGYGDTQ